MAHHLNRDQLWWIAAFLVAVIVPFSGMHYVVASDLATYLGSIIPLIVFGVMGLWGVSVFFLLRVRRNPLTRNYIRVGMIWNGLMYLTFLSWMILWVITRFVDLPDAALVAIIAGAALACKAAYNARVPKVREVTLEAPVKRETRIVQLSDIHLGDFYGPGFLASLIEETRKLKPDVIVFSGDIVDGMEDVPEEWFTPLRRLPKDVPAIFIRGNHDEYNDASLVEHLLAKHQVEIVNDEIIERAGITLVGARYGAKQADVVRLLRSAKQRSKPVVLLEHEPAHLRTYAEEGPDLILAGHTHDGQMWPLGYLARIQYDHGSGTTRMKDTVVHISVGAGCWGPPYRFGNRSEITLVRLTPPGNRSS